MRAASDDIPFYAHAQHPNTNTNTNPTTTHLLRTQHRCYKAVGLSVDEVKDCVKAAAMAREYVMPRPVTEFSIQREVEEAVDKMMVREGCS